MTDKELIKSLKRSLQGAGFKISKLQEEITILEAESRHNVSMYSIDEVEYLKKEYAIIETQFREYMEKNKSFWFWLSQRFNKQWLNR